MRTSWPQAPTSGQQDLFITIRYAVLGTYPAPGKKSNTVCAVRPLGIPSRAVPWVGHYAKVPVQLYSALHVRCWAL